jgi:1L-myo-inositol 1-phosphate cytidylyltransferase / CDP-L-myo-inositol myo-inositolphosphotransferase
VGLRTRVAGLPLSRRIALAATRAGFDRVVGMDSLGEGPDGGLAGPVATEPASPARERPGRIVILAADVVPQTSWLRTLRTAPLQPETLSTDAVGVAVIETHDPEGVFDVVHDCRTIDEMVKELSARVPSRPDVFDTSGRFRLWTAGDARDAEAWLLQSLVKEHEGFMSRHVERRVSLAITRRLAGTGITPNVMTLVSVAIGLVAAPFFLSASAAYQLAGALLFLTHSIVDGCDGELARLEFRESRVGALLDFWGDNLVHVAIFGAIAVGWSVQAGTVWPLIVGAVSIASTLGTAVVVGRYAIGDAKLGNAPSLASRLVDTLAHRDFIYVVVGLAAIGKASWFLVLSAAGTPLFLLLFAVSSAAVRDSESR